MDRRIRQTATASPAEPGGLPLTLGMIDPSKTSLSQPACTAFDGARQIASGSYVQVALALKPYDGAHPEAAVLVFDDATGKQIDFDLRGSDADIAARLQKRFPAAQA